MAVILIPRVRLVSVKMLQRTCYRPFNDYSFTLRLMRAVALIVRLSARVNARYSLLMKPL